MNRNGPTLPGLGTRRRPSNSDSPSLDKITTTTKKLPSRIIIHAVEKWGKTSFGAQAPKPIFLMTRGEDGLLTLIDNGRLPPTPHFPDCLESWLDLKLALHELLVKDHEHKSVVVDTLNGCERLAAEHVIDSEFGGDFEKFDAWGKSGQRLLPLMVELTSILDRLREKGMAIMLLAHSVVKTFKNPEGLDYPRWEPPLVKEVQEHLDRWSDAILFGKCEVITEAADKKATKGKAIGGQARLLMTEAHATYKAGNRLGLPEEIACGSSPAEAWSNFISALKATKEPK